MCPQKAHLYVFSSLFIKINSLDTSLSLVDTHFGFWHVKISTAFSGSFNSSFSTTFSSFMILTVAVGSIIETASRFILILFAIFKISILRKIVELAFKNIYI